MRHEPTSAALGIAPILTKEELAAVLRVHPRTIERLVVAGDIPAGRRIGRQVRWLRDDLLEALGVDCGAADAAKRRRR